jgi:hypothetical protein
MASSKKNAAFSGIAVLLCIPHRFSDLRESRLQLLETFGELAQVVPRQQGCYPSGQGRFRHAQHPGQPGAQKPVPLQQNRPHRRHVQAVVSQQMAGRALPAFFARLAPVSEIGLIDPFHHWIFPHSYITAETIASAFRRWSKTTGIPATLSLRF